MVTSSPPASARSTAPEAQAAPVRADAWTGGQYSLFRAFLGLSLAGHFAWLAMLSADLVAVPARGLTSPALDWLVSATSQGTAVVTLRWLLVVGCVAHLALAAGWKDRLFALLLAAFWVCLFGRDPLVSVEGQAVVVALLMMHAAMPRAPYGSLEAYARIDPRGGWKHATRIWTLGWVVLGAGCALTGWQLLQQAAWADGTALAQQLNGPAARPWFITDALANLPVGVTTAATYGVLGATLLFAPLVLVRRLRPWLWMLLLVSQPLRIALFDVDNAAPMIILLLAFTFDPAWLAPKGGKGPSTVFYDGECGLCHRFVRMLLAEDRSGDTFRFAPLKGQTFAVAVPEGALGQLPDSVVVHTPCGDLLMHSDAALHCLRRLGGLWRLIATLAGLVPRPVRDTVYKGIAAVRKSIFAKPDNACPILPPDLQQRFLR